MIQTHAKYPKSHSLTLSVLMVYKKVTRWHCSYILVPSPQKGSYVTPCVILCSKIHTPNESLKKRDAKMDKKTLNPHTTKGYFYRWHKLPTVTVYMFALYFSLFSPTFWGGTGDRPATRGPCAPEINTGSKVSPGKRAATPSAKAANFPQRESTEEEESTGGFGGNFGGDL